MLRPIFSACKNTITNSQKVPTRDLYTKRATNVTQEGFEDN